MLPILKPIVSVLMFLIVLFFISTMLSITTSQPIWLRTTIALAGALITGWSVWKVVAGEKVTSGLAIISGALMLGGLSFIVGFLGPMMFAQDTSQGPLIGLFIAAPLGVITGAIGGYLYASKHNEVT